MSTQAGTKKADSQAASREYRQAKHMAKKLWERFTVTQGASMLR